jgi:hypothetical protein
MVVLRAGRWGVLMVVKSVAHWVALKDIHWAVRSDASWEVCWVDLRDSQLVAQRGNSMVECSGPTKAEQKAARRVVPTEIQSAVSKAAWWETCLVVMWGLLLVGSRAGLKADWKAFPAVVHWVCH